MSSSGYSGYRNPTRYASSSGAGIGGVPRKMAKGIREIFKSGPLPTIFKKPYLRLFKFFFIVSAIVFIIIGLFLIDDSCGCVRMQDKLMMWMLKIHVIISILLLLIGIMFTEKYPRLSMLLLFITVTGILGVDSWIFYNYKRCIGKSEMQNSDKRFLTWIVTLMVIAGALWLGLLIIFGVIVNKYGKQQVTAQVKTDTLQVERLYQEALSKMKKSVEEPKIVYYKKILQNRDNLKKNGITDIPDSYDDIFSKIDPQRIIQILKTSENEGVNTEGLQKMIRDEKQKYDRRKKKLDSLTDKYKDFSSKCTTENTVSSECDSAKKELKEYIASI